jgi:hypothetical protein
MMLHDIIVTVNAIGSPDLTLSPAAGVVVAAHEVHPIDENGWSSKHIIMLIRKSPRHAKIHSFVSKTQTSGRRDCTATA